MVKTFFLGLFVATLALPLAAQTKTLLNLDKAGVAIPVNKDTKGHLAKANTNWPALVEKKGK